MSDFNLVQGNYDNVPHLIIRRIPEFLESPEFESLSLKWRILPGIVCGALGKFLVRTFSASLPEGKPEDLIARLFLLLEEMASDHDSQVQNLVVVEIFEHLDCDEDTLQAIIVGLFPKSKSLYNKYIE